MRKNKNLPKVQNLVLVHVIKSNKVAKVTKREKLFIEIKQIVISKLISNDLRVLFFFNFGVLVLEFAQCKFLCTVQQGGLENKSPKHSVI